MSDSDSDDIDLSLMEKNDDVCIMYRFPKEDEPKAKNPKLSRTRPYFPVFVNRATLSYHSEYFKRTFDNSPDPLEGRWVEVISRKEDVATFFSLIRPNPSKVTESNYRNILEFSECFHLPAAKRHVEFFLMTSSKDRWEKIRIAEKYQLEELLTHTISKCFDRNAFEMSKKEIGTLKEETKAKIFEKAMEFRHEKGPVSVGINYENRFLKTDKTDAILVVDGKKLHVNKALLSYHSDYFNTLFNSNFKEKSMEEIPIKDVEFEDFATFLSLVQKNPIMPTEFNAEKLLELSDRFLLPAAKHHVELFLFTTSIDLLDKLRIADAYQLKDFLETTIELFKKNENFENLQKSGAVESLSNTTKSQLLNNFLRIV